MPRITALDPTEAPTGSRDLLDDIIGRHGDAGPMIRTMAHSPALLRGYLDLSRAMKRVKLARAISEKVSLAVQGWIGCEKCLAAHTAAARAVGLTETDITLASQGTATNHTEAALLGFALQVLVEPSAVTDQNITELRELGWSDRALADIVGLVALNQLTGSFNLVAGLEMEPTPGNQSTASLARV